jgi:hypothetical protein
VSLESRSGPPSTNCRQLTQNIQNPQQNPSPAQLFKPSTELNYIQNPYLLIVQLLIYHDLPSFGAYGGLVGTRVVVSVIARKDQGVQCR